MTAHIEAFRLTTGELAFAVPIGVILAAVISFMALRWSTNRTIKNTQETLDKTLEAQRVLNQETLQSQRRMAQEERLWEKRAELYVEVIDVLTRFNHAQRDSFDLFRHNLDRIGKGADCLVMSPTATEMQSTGLIFESTMQDLDARMRAFADFYAIQGWDALLGMTPALTDFATEFVTLCRKYDASQGSQRAEQLEFISETYAKASSANESVAVGTSNVIGVMRTQLDSNDV